MGEHQTHSRAVNTDAGSVYAQLLEKRISSIENKLDKLEKKFDLILWGLCGIALLSATAVVMLGLNLALR